MRAIVLVILFALVTPTVWSAAPVVTLLVDGAPADRLAGFRARLSEPTTLDDVWPGPAHAEAMGDATGDGLGETLIVHLPTREETDASTFAFRVLSPPGTMLWLTETTADNVEWLTGHDFDGDGRSDILFVTLSFPEKKQPSDALPKGGGPTLREWEWRATVMRGGSPEVLWERAESGTALVSDVALLAASDFFAPIVGPDADGDGGADVWLNVLDRAVTQAGEIRVDRFELLSGATGEPSTRLPLPATGSVVAFPMGDADGDGLADTLATVELGATTSAVAFSAGAPLWATPFPAPGVAFPIVDVTGDAGEDAVFIQNDDTHTFLDGATGAALWTIVDPPFLGVLPGNVDGDAGNDVVFLDAQFDGSLGAVVARTLALAGDTGAELYDTHPFSAPLPENGGVSVELRLLGGDMDGDGVDEILFNTEWGPFLERDAAEAHSVHGATGLLLWTHSGLDYAAHAIGDVTGDGRADALRWEIPLDRSSWGYGVVDGPSGVLLWDRADVVDGVSAVALGNAGGSAAGDAGFLVIAGGDSRLDVRDGSGGSLIWAAP